MITDWIISLGAGFVTWLVSLFPTVALPDWFTGFGASLNQAIAALSGMGGWVDWVVLTACVAWTLGAWALFAGIKTTRAGIAHVPGVGGAG